MNIVVVILLSIRRIDLLAMCTGSEQNIVDRIRYSVGEGVHNENMAEKKNFRLSSTSL